MPLVIENGTGVAGADSWVSVVEADAFFSNRNITEWTDKTVAAREAALRIAADYLMFAYRWPGQASTVVQRLPWPRYGVRSGSGYFPPNMIPTQVVDAQILLSLEAGRTNILERVTPAQQKIEESKSMKGMSKTLKWATSPVDDVSRMRRFPTIDSILRGIALGSLGGDFAQVPIERV